MTGGFATFYNFLPATTIAYPIAFFFMSGKGSAMY